MIRIPTARAPTHPGEMLLEEFLLPMAVTPHELADAIHTSRDAIDALVQSRAALTPGIGLRLAKFFGVSADFWMNLQLRWDLYHAQRAEAETLQTIRPHKAA